MMINSLVESALTTGCISVASESLIGQILHEQLLNPSDVQALRRLNEALHQGLLKREARAISPFWESINGIETNSTLVSGSSA